MRPAWTPQRAIAIAAGGAIGATARWAVVTVFAAQTFPWPVLAINVSGSFLLGVLLAEEAARPRARIVVHDAGAIGLCGGLTTFSTFAVEVAGFLRDGRGATAVTYAVASVLSAIVAVVLGAAARRRVRAVTLPLEEVP